MIAKLAFEQSLKIDSTYWPSLDHFIILVYALGNYSRNKPQECLVLKRKFKFNNLSSLSKIHIQCTQTGQVLHEWHSSNEKDSAVQRAVLFAANRNVYKHQLVRLFMVFFFKYY